MGQEPLLFRRVVVALDRPGPGSGAWIHALDWAIRLHLPLQVLSFTGAEDHAPRGPFPGRGRSEEIAGAAEEIHSAGEARRLLDPNDLFVLCHTFRPAWKKLLLRELWCAEGPALLVCPEDRTPLHRALVLYAGNDPASGYLVRALRVCACLGARPVVLTVDWSESGARQQQQVARRVLSECGLRGDFDYIVGPETGAAVASAARWRRCPLVILEQEARAGWRRWLPRRVTEPFLPFTETLALLALPAAGRPALIREPTWERTAGLSPLSGIVPKEGNVPG